MVTAIESRAPRAAAAPPSTPGPCFTDERRAGILLAILSPRLILESEASLSRLLDRVRYAMRRLAGHSGHTAERLARIESSVRDANKRLVRLGRQVNDSRFGLRASLRRLEREMDAVLRHQTLVTDRLPYPYAITARRFSLSSQNEEDGMIQALIGDCPVQSRSFVELGCGSNGGNSGALARELGWRGLMVDADEGKIGMARAAFSNAKVKLVRSWITRDNVNDLVAEAGLAGDLGLLSIDVDGNDYWIWEAVSACRPLLVVIEYNSMFGPKWAASVPYDESFDRHAFPRAPDGKAIYFGASLEALRRLGSRKGYRLVAVEPRGVNAFFLLNGYRPEIPASSPKDCHRVLDKYIGHSLEKLVDAHDLPVEAIPEPADS